MKTILIGVVVFAAGLAGIFLFFTLGSGHVIYVSDQVAKHMEKGSFLLNKRRHTADRNDKAELLTKAIDEFKSAMEAKPNYDVAHNMLGHSYIERGMWDAALVELDKAIDLRHDYPAALFNRGFVYRKIALSKREHSYIDKAIADYQTAMSSELSAPISGDLLKALAEAHHQKDDLEEAILYYKKYLKKTPHASDVQLIVRKIHGLTLMLKGNTSKQKNQAD